LLDLSTTIFNLSVVITMFLPASVTVNAVCRFQVLFTTRDGFVLKELNMVYFTSMISALHTFILSKPLSKLKLTPSVSFLKLRMLALARGILKVHISINKDTHNLLNLKRKFLCNIIGLYIFRLNCLINRIYIAIKNAAAMRTYIYTPIPVRVAGNL